MPRQEFIGGFIDDDEDESDESFEIPSKSKANITQSKKPATSSFSAKPKTTVKDVMVKIYQKKRDPDWKDNSVKI